VLRPALLFAFLVLAPGAALSFFALRAADGERAEGVKLLAARVEDEARAQARRVEAVLEEAVLEAERRGAVGHAREGRWLGYTPDAPAVAAEDFDPGELSSYDLSARGGASFEFALGDPARAIDAYAFALPRLRSPVLRARLQLGAGRAALALGADVGHERALGERLLRDLFARTQGLASEDGLPLDLLAAALLARGPAAADAGFAAAARARLAEHAPRLATASLEILARALAPADGELRSLIAARRELEAAVAAHPQVLSAPGAVLDGASLLASRPAGGAHGGGLLAVLRTEVAVPDAAAAGLAVRLVPLAAADANAALRGPGRAAAPVRLGKDGPAVAVLAVEDPAFPARLAALDRRRAVQLGLVALLAAVTLAGGAALVRYAVKERRVARLRELLLANVSHELKTPVTSIRMFTELLAAAPDAAADPERARRYVEHLDAESARLSALVDDLLDAVRLGRAPADLPVEPVDLAALARRVADGFAFRAAAEKVAFRAEGLPMNGAGPAVFTAPANAAAVERILQNLLDNALKYRRAEGAEVRLAIARDADRVRLTVADNGPGIPSADRERVFDEFYRARYEDYGVKGSGLGLSIARRLARKLGGDVTLECGRGAGCAFTLELPATEVHEPRADPHR
jgi:signal transduction histidine kinase